jgi:hypothetical protein
MHVKIKALRAGDAPHQSVSIRQHTSACVSIRQHTSAYVSIRQEYTNIFTSGITHRGCRTPSLKNKKLTSYLCMGKKKGITRGGCHTSICCSRSPAIFLIFLYACKKKKALRAVDAAHQFVVPNHLHRWTSWAAACYSLPYSVAGM